jgi:hypothetical protein
MFFCLAFCASERVELRTSTRTKSNKLKAVKVITSSVSKSYSHLAYNLSPKLVTARVRINTESLKNDVTWDVTPCGSCKNRRFG